MTYLLQIIDFPATAAGDYIRTGLGPVGLNYFKFNSSAKGWALDENYWQVDSDDIIGPTKDPEIKKLTKRRELYIFPDFP